MIEVTTCGLLGDALMCTPAIRALYEKTTGGQEFVVRVPEALYPLFYNFPYSDRVEHVSPVEWNTSVEPAIKSVWHEQPGKKSIIMDASMAFNLSFALGRHELYGHGLPLGVEVKDPHLVVNVPEEEQLEHMNVLRNRIGDSRYIVCTPYSKCCGSRRGEPANKMIPFEIWEQVRLYLKVLGYEAVFVSGLDEPQPPEIDGVTWYSGSSLRAVATWMRNADLCIVLDNGAGHLAAAMDANILHLNGAIPLFMIEMSHTKGKYVNIDAHDHGGIRTIGFDHIRQGIEMSLPPKENK